MKTPSFVVRRWSLALIQGKRFCWILIAANHERLTATAFFHMRVAYLECFSGISGDMFLGALVDAGIPAKALAEMVAGLNIGARLEISRVLRGGISATKVDVWVNGEKDLPREEYWKKQRVAHAHEAKSRVLQEQHHHSHDHKHFDVEMNAGPVEASARHVHGRGLAEIREIIHRAPISETAKKTATKIFEVLGAAEAKIHDTSTEDVHFHEVGAVDAIVDIVCAAVGAEMLGVDEIVCSPLNVGGGTVECAHGTFPVPAPATLELMQDAPVYSSEIEAELVTPTGAAIVKVLANRFAKFPMMKIEKSGYGAGSRDFPAHPNVLRLTLGETSQSSSASLDCDTISVLEANLDDLNPQVFGYVIERLMNEGALDAFGTPVQMKKSRPGMLLSVLCKPEDANKLSEIIFAETTTLGVRRRDENRQTLVRRWENVRTEWGEVSIKIASINGTVTNYAPEYEDCRKLAATYHVPLKTVMQEAIRRYLENEKH